MVLPFSQGTGFRSFGLPDRDDGDTAERWNP